MIRAAIVVIGAIAVLITVASHARAETGLASWYGSESGNRTANGERFNPNGVSCAHRTRPLGSWVTVTYAGRSMPCRINDRGPAKWTGRIIDLSLGGARLLGFVSAGVVRVTVE